MLIAARQSFLTGTKPPYDAEIEYLESTGTQYIDTGVTFTDFDSCRISFKVSKTVNTNSCIMGAYYDDASAPKFQIFLDTANKVGYMSGVATADGLAYGQRITVGTRYNVSFTTTTQNVTSAHVFLFARNSDRGNLLLFNGLQICSVELQKGSKIVRSFAPVRIGQTGYFYDRISKKLFANNGTGNFVLGNDITKIEYLEGTGDQFIDTGYKTSQSSRMLFDVMYNGYQYTGYGSTMLFGSQTTISGSASTALALWLNSNGQMSFNDIGFDSGWIQFPVISVGSRHKFLIDNRTLYVDGASVIASSSTTAYRSTVSTCLLRANTPSGYQTGNNRHIKGRIYSFTVSEEGVTLFDGSPVRVGSVGYLYDRVSKWLFGNAGTGNFVLGPDK